jgi:PAS domain S-box-containing protein
LISFEEVFRKFNYPSVILNEEGVIIERNESFSKLFDAGGHSRLKDYFSSEFHNQFEASLKSAKDGKQTGFDIIDSFHIDTVPSYRAEFFHAEGNIPVIIAILYDISESKRHENAMLRAASSWRLIFDSIIDPICLTDPDGQVIRCNSSFASLVGTGYEKILGKSLISWFPGLAGSGNKQETRQLSGRFHDVYEWNGRVFRFITDTYSGEGSKIAGVIYIFQDITEEKAAEKALMEVEHLNAEIMDAINSPIYYKDLKGVYRACNRAFCEFAGVTKDRIVGATPFDIFPRERAELYHKKDEELKAAGGKQSFELEDINTGGNVRKFIFYKSLILDSQDKPQGIACIIVDITDLKKAEEKIRASLHEKEVLLKEIHHRVKNNLNIIASLLRLKRDVTESDNVKDILNESISRVYTMALIHEKLYRSEDLSKIVVCKYINDLASTVIENYNIQYRIDLKIECDDFYLDIGKMVPFGLILNEMITNSIKYAFREKNKREINIVLKKSGAYKMRLRYSDSGPGISQDIDFDKPVTLGMQLIRDLATQLGGTVSLSRGKETYYEVEFTASQ